MGLLGTPQLGYPPGFPGAGSQNRTTNAAGAGEAVWRGKCKVHGYKAAIYKCDSCCSVATFDCRSNHYCSSCHNRPHEAKNNPCPGPELCPLGIPHPPNKSGIHGQVDFGFVIGCSRCFSGADDLVLQHDSSAVEGVEHWRERFDAEDG